MSTKIFSIEENTIFMNFPSRGLIVAHIDGGIYTADVSQFSQYPLPSDLEWINGRGDRAEIQFDTPMVFW